MKKFHLLLTGLACWFASLSGFSETIPIDQAEQVARNVILERANGITPAFDFSNPELISKWGYPLYYAFLSENRTGFLIISADDRFPPVLAYSFDSQITEAGSPPPAYTWFMGQLELQMREAFETNLSPDSRTLADWQRYADPSFSPGIRLATLSPLVQTTWDQGCYYNEDCPDDNSATNYCYHALTGCGATAMAQIIKFWSVPAHGVGSHSYNHPTYGVLSANFAAATYQYSAMPASLSTYNTEVAELMYHCGVAQDMDYGPAGSSSYVDAIDDAFRDYFDYSSQLDWQWRSNYTSAQWISLLTAELDAGRPMLYYGNDNGQGGHFFVCDGYQGSGYFHFNWGWGGSYDGYFYTSNLNPGSNQFNDNQGAIVNILPNQTPPPPVGVTMNFETVSDFSLTFDPWTVADLDGSNTYTIQDYTFPNQGVPMAYICFNPASVSPAMTGPAIQPHGGSRLGACFAATSPPNNDWFISPQVQLGTGGEFSFWVKSYTDQYGLERFKVGVSTTNNSPGSFTFISGSSYLEAPTEWTKKTFDLSAFNNQKVYVAIQCISSDAFIFMIDDLEVKTGGSSGLVADFAASQTTVGAGNSVNFEDMSSGSPTSWQWSFPGGTPSSSTLQDPAGIKYNTPGAYDVTLTVSDGANQDTHTKTGYITVIQTGPPSYMTLDFEGLTDFTTTFAPWTTADMNGGNTYLIQDVTFPHNGEEMAYICFNPGQTSPPMTNMHAHSGSRLGACFSSIQPYNPNNKWLISPQVQLGNNPAISLWVASYTDVYGFEQYNIGVSATGNNPSSFVIINTGGAELAPLNWTERSYSLAGFANQVVYVGIQCVSNDAFIFMIDDIVISGNVGTPESLPEESVTVFPNPASERVCIGLNESFPEQAEFRLANALGEVILEIPDSRENNRIELNTSGLKPGMYYLIILHETATLVRKISVVR